MTNSWRSLDSYAFTLRYNWVAGALVYYLMQCVRLLCTNDEGSKKLNGYRNSLLKLCLYCAKKISISLALPGVSGCVRLQCTSDKGRLEVAMN